MWDQLIAKNWTGCDLEVNESGVIYRGQIKSIERTADSLQVIMRWCAMLISDGTWRFDPPANFLEPAYFSFPTIQTVPSDIGQGRMALQTPIGMAIFFPREVSRLDPAKVRGLPPEFAEPDFVDPK